MCLFDEVDALSRQTQHIFEQIFSARNEPGVSFTDLQDTTGLSAGDLQAIIAGRTPPIDWTSVKSTVRLSDINPTQRNGGSNATHSKESANGRGALKWADGQASAGILAAHQRRTTSAPQVTSHCIAEPSKKISHEVPTKKEDKMTTCRLWAWRDEAGGHYRWADRLGAALVAHGPDALYPAIQCGSEVVQ